MEQKEFVDWLLNDLKIPEELLVEKGLVVPRFNELVDLAHTIFCNSSHNKDCRYYDEEVLNTVWDEPAHNLWKNSLIHLNISYADLAKALRVISDDLETSVNIHKIISSIPRS